MPIHWWRLARLRYNTMPSSKTRVGYKYKINRSSDALTYCSPAKSKKLAR